LLRYNLNVTIFSALNIKGKVMVNLVQLV